MSRTTFSAVALVLAQSVSANAQPPASPASAPVAAASAASPFAFLPPIHTTGHTISRIEPSEKTGIVCETLPKGGTHVYQVLNDPFKAGRKFFVEAKGTPADFTETFKVIGADGKVQTVSHNRPAATRALQECQTLKLNR